MTEETKILYLSEVLDYFTVNLKFVPSYSEYIEICDKLVKEGVLLRKCHQGYPQRYEYRKIADFS